MPRFFVSKTLLGEETFLEGEDARHLSRSLRAREGEKIILSDGEGSDFLYEITGFTRDRVSLRVLEKLESESEPDIRVTLFLASAKGDKTEFMIQKAVESGAAALQPFISRNCISRPEPGKKSERWNRVAAEAAMQSGRSVVPPVSEIVTFQEAVKKAVEFFFRHVLPDQMLHGNHNSGERLNRQRHGADMGFGRIKGCTVLISVVQVRRSLIVESYDLVVADICLDLREGLHNTIFCIHIDVLFRLCRRTGWSRPRLCLVYQVRASITSPVSGSAIGRSSYCCICATVRPEA